MKTAEGAVEVRRCFESIAAAELFRKQLQSGNIPGKVMYRIGGC
jgi:hypothetical protein